MQLHQRKKEFEDCNTQVLIIGFENKRRSRGWLEQTGVTFPFLLDLQKKVYRAYEIERSLLRSFSPRNLWSYVKAVFQGKKITLFRGDPSQLGADFIVDKQGILRKAYYSKDPTYRPEISEILEQLRIINNNGGRYG